MNILNDLLGAALSENELLNAAQDPTVPAELRFASMRALFQVDPSLLAGSPHYAAWSEFLDRALLDPAMLPPEVLPDMIEFFLGMPPSVWSQFDRAFYTFVKSTPNAGREFLAYASKAPIASRSIPGGTRWFLWGLSARVTTLSMEARKNPALSLGEEIRLAVQAIEVLVDRMVAWYDDKRELYRSIIPRLLRGLFPVVSDSLLDRVLAQPHSMLKPGEDLDPCEMISPYASLPQILTPQRVEALIRLRHELIDAELAINPRITQDPELRILVRRLRPQLLE